jgi:signal transduction histidine kinase
MFSSIRARLWLSYAALIVAALSIAAVVLVVFLLRNPLVYRQTSARIRAAESLLVRQPRAVGGLELVAHAFEVRVQLFAADGSLLSDSDRDAAALSAPATGLSLRRAAVLRDSSGGTWLYSRTRLADGNWLVVAARRPKLLPMLAVLKDELWRPLVQGGLIALLLSLVLAYVLARWIADPLQQLVGAARRVSTDVSAGHVDVGARDGHAVSNTETRQVPERGPREVRQLIRALNAMLNRVRSSQRSQRDFVANVSHELKTPLTSIQGFAQALMDGTAATPAARRQAAQVIHAEAGRMHRMALELTELARLDAGTANLRMEPVDVRRLLEELVISLKPAADSTGVRLQLTVPDEAPNITGDAERLTQAIANLVDNALKFTPRGGLVEIGAQPDATGLISQGDIPHVFERFYQADSARGGGARHGAGLGLAIARDIITAHGGKITIRSALGQGAEFTVHLPLVSRPGG